jgi:hypothetical protein
VASYAITQINLTVNTQKPISNTEALLTWSKFLKEDDDAFTSLVGIFSSPLYQQEIRVIKDIEFMAECIQNLFFELWNRCFFLKPTGSVKFYLFKFLRNQIYKDYPKWNMHDSINHRK